MGQTVTDIFFIYAVLLAALGTYLIRAVPFLLSARKKKRSNPLQINLFFQLMGPSMIAALLVNSIRLPNSEDYFQILNYLIGFTGVGASYWLWKNPGICVLAGVISFSVSQLFFI